MSKVRVELNLAGINDLMKSAEIQVHLQAAGEAVAAQASATSDGADYSARTHLANWVAITNVYPDSKEAAKRNFEGNTLLKAVGAVGLPLSKDAAKRGGE